jgi:hypothetical protein
MRNRSLGPDPLSWLADTDNAHKVATAIALRWTEVEVSDIFSDPLKSDGLSPSVTREDLGCCELPYQLCAEQVGLQLPPAYQQGRSNTYAGVTGRTIAVYRASTRSLGTSCASPRAVTH